MYQNLIGALHIKCSISIVKSVYRSALTNNRWRPVEMYAFACNFIAIKSLLIIDYDLTYEVGLFWRKCHDIEQRLSLCKFRYFFLNRLTACRRWFISREAAISRCDAHKKNLLTFFFLLVSCLTFSYREETLKRREIWNIHCARLEFQKFWKLNTLEIGLRRRAAIDNASSFMKFIGKCWAENNIVIISALPSDITRIGGGFLTHLNFAAKNGKKKHHRLIINRHRAQCTTFMKYRRAETAAAAAWKWKIRVESLETKEGNTQSTHNLRNQRRKKKAFESTTTTNEKRKFLIWYRSMMARSRLAFQFCLIIQELKHLTSWETSFSRFIYALDSAISFSLCFSLIAAKKYEELKK